MNRDNTAVRMTLNQLLVELDGLVNLFDVLSHKKIVLKGVSQFGLSLFSLIMFYFYFLISYLAASDCHFKVRTERRSRCDMCH